jgi:hypothetical protein
MINKPIDNVKSSLFKIKSFASLRCRKRAATMPLEAYFTKYIGYILIKYKTKGRAKSAAIKTEARKFL